LIVGLFDDEQEKQRQGTQVFMRWMLDSQAGQVRHLPLLIGSVSGKCRLWGR
jgi:hypothetical protein